MLSSSLSTNLQLEKWARDFRIPLNQILFTYELGGNMNSETPHSNFILNMGSPVEGGTHWVALYIPKTGSKAYYFDSFGQPPDNRIVLYCNERNKKILYNHVIIQNSRSGYCGQYCLVFLYYMNHAPGNYNERYNKFLYIFS